MRILTSKTRAIARRIPDQFDLNYDSHQYQQPGRYLTNWYPLHPTRPFRDLIRGLDLSRVAGTLLQGEDGTYFNAATALETDSSIALAEGNAYGAVVFSISAWAYIDSPANAAAPLTGTNANSYGAGYPVGLSADAGTGVCHLWADPYNSIAGVTQTPRKQWVHVVATHQTIWYGGNINRIYLNGKLDGEATGQVEMSMVPAFPLTIGGFTYAAAPTNYSFLSGTIRDVRVAYGVWSAEEIAEQYDNPTDLYLPWKPRSYFFFDAPTLYASGRNVGIAKAAIIVQRSIAASATGGAALSRAKAVAARTLAARFRGGARATAGLAVQSVSPLLAKARGGTRATGGLRTMARSGTLTLTARIVTS